MQRDKDQTRLCGGRRYLLSLLFIQWAFFIPFICQLLHSSFSSLLRASRVVVKALRYAVGNASVQGAALDWLDSSLDTLSPYLTATASLRQYILWYVWPPCGCGALEEVAVGGMALTE